jgi:DNA topoisomerase I
MEPKRLPALQAVVIEPAASAKAVGLRYVTDRMPGLRRVKAGEDFQYLDPEGKPAGAEDQRRIRSLAIPPAWTEVWICPLPHGHLQATGHDARGRKQYRYHPRWRKARDETKYTRMVKFADALPGIRRRVQRDLQLPGLPKRKVLAAVVRLLEVSLIRVGNEEYARENKSFGLTTMRDRHVEVSGSTLHFEFRGKSGRQHAVRIDDPRLARVVKSCQELPGQELFQCLDEAGQRQDIDSTDVNDYLKEISGEDFTAKDFRTWAGTVLAARALQEFEEVDSQAKAKKNIVQAIEAVAQVLGNTPAICRKCYVHPAVLEAYLDGALIRNLRQQAEERMASALGRLRPEEAVVLALLQKRLLAEERGRNGTRRMLRNSLARSKADLTSVRHHFSTRTRRPGRQRTSMRKKVLC